MTEVLTQPAATLPAPTEVLTPPPVTTPTTTAAGAPADGATTPTPSMPAQPSVGLDGLTVGGTKVLDSAEGLNQLVQALEKGDLRFVEASEAPSPEVATPAVEPVTTEVAPATPAGEPIKSDDDTDEGLPVPGQLPKSLKIKTQGDALRFETLKIVKARDESGQPIGFAEAESLARQVLGLPIAATPVIDAPTDTGGDASEVPAADDSTVDVLPATKDATLDKIKDLNREKAYLAANFRWEEAAEIENRILDLQVLFQSQIAVEAQSEQANVTYADQWTKSASQAASAYAAHGAADTDSALSIVAASIQADWVRQNDSRLADPAAAPGLIYAAALAKINPTAVAPATQVAAPTVPAATPSPSPTVQPSPLRALTPAQALLSSASGAGTPHGPAKFDLGTIKSAQDLESLAATLNLK
jgi:hypothetical protein